MFYDRHGFPALDLRAEWLYNLRDRAASLTANNRIDLDSTRAGNVSTLKILFLAAFSVNTVTAGAVIGCGLAEALKVRQKKAGTNAAKMLSLIVPPLS